VPFLPDAFYSCGSNNAAAEAAHWPDFLATAVQHWKTKYGHIDLRNKSHDKKIIDKAMGLKAFIYGLFTHQVADVGWHSLGVNQGLLEVLAQSEFNRSIEKAHRSVHVKRGSSNFSNSYIRFLDTGGDLLMLDRYGSSNWLKVDTLLRRLFDLIY
jgi:glycosylphosphatidylinositol phospholipase D